MQAGYYLYFVEMPEEGVLGPLGDDNAPQEALLSATPPAPAPVVPSRDDIIQCLLAARGPSVGLPMVADAILGLLASPPQPAEQDRVCRWVRETGRSPSYIMGCNTNVSYSPGLLSKFPSRCSLCKRPVETVERE